MMNYGISLLRYIVTFSPQHALSCFPTCCSVPCYVVSISVSDTSSAKYYSDVTQSRLDVIQEGQDEYPQLNEVVGQFKCFISSEMNRGALFYIFDPFILS